MTKARRWLLLVAALASSCTSGPPFAPVAVIPAEKALLYIYSPTSKGGYSAEVFVNGLLVVVLPAGGYCSYVPYFTDPGKVRVAITRIGTRRLDLETEAGGTYYVRGGMSLLGDPSIELVSAETGAVEIKACKHLLATSASPPVLSVRGFSAST